MSLNGADADVLALIKRLKTANIFPLVENGQLKFRAHSAAALTDELRQAILRHKTRLISSWPMWESQGEVDESIPPSFDAGIGSSSFVQVLQHHQGLWNSMASGRPGVDVTNLTHFVCRASRSVASDSVRNFFKEVAARHPILRRRVITKNSRYVFSPPDDECPSHIYTDVSNDDSHSRGQLLSSTISTLVWKPFDSLAGSLFRSFHVRVDENEHVLGFVIHHFVADFTSVGILAGELLTHLGRGELPPISTRDINYMDYVVGIDNWLNSEASTPSRRYWESVLRDALPTRLPRLTHDSVVREGTAAIEVFHVPQENCLALRSLAAACRVTPFCLFLGLNMFALATISGATDITMLIDTSCRMNPRLSSTIGYLVNFLPIRFSISMEQTLEDLLLTISNLWRNGERHLYYPYYTLSPDLTRVGTPDVFPVLNYINRPNFARENGVEPMDIGAPPIVTPTKNFIDSHYTQLEMSNNGLLGRIHYPPWMYSRETVLRFIELYIELLDKCVDSRRLTLTELLAC